MGCNQPHDESYGHICRHGCQLQRCPSVSIMGRYGQVETTDANLWGCVGYFGVGSLYCKDRFFVCRLSEFVRDFIYVLILNRYSWC